MTSRLLTVREQIVLGGLAVALLVGAATAVWMRDDPDAPLTPVEEEAPGGEELAAVEMAPAVPVVPDPEPAPAAAVEMPPPPPEDIGVAIMGAVERPGYYEVPADSRVGDLINIARGETPRARLDALNLSARLIDGATLTIPFEDGTDADGIARPGANYNPPSYLLAAQYNRTARTSGSTPSTPVTPNAPSDNRDTINLNTADRATLETLPGIGPALAQRIIAYREGSPFTTVEDLDNVSGIGPKRLEAVRDLVTAGP
jgi:competence protein ComEA